jgi:nucleotide-binding universal stress UspA family protein
MSQESGQMNDAPILIAYDGSDSARRAVHEAGKLFGPRRAVVVTVWEPDLGYEVAAMSSPTDLEGAGPGAFDVAEAQEVNDALRARAERIAHDGAELARSVGLEVSGAVAVPDERNVAEAILELARERRAAAIIIGSRGLSGLRARLEGSTSDAVLKHAACPVVVVHDD